MPKSDKKTGGNGMKNYWYVLIENYDNGDVNAAIIKSKLLDKKPDDFH
jgi:hypothetical protein